ncbi:uncharacterized protein DS421_3g67790 [Arachis hypogaea]|nr:uncharacterized protein DS421_3g67790 [Arachis hypogaea]
MVENSMNVREADPREEALGDHVDEEPHTIGVDSDEERETIPVRQTSRPSDGSATQQYLPHLLALNQQRFLDWVIGLARRVVSGSCTQ